MLSTKIMNPFSWALNDWYICFQVASLILLAGTVLTGAGALITGFVINKRQNLALEEQRQKTADSEAKLFALQHKVEADRSIKREVAERLLTVNSEPPLSKVLIGVVSQEEPGRFGNALATLLRDHKWNVSGPNQIISSTGGFAPGVQIQVYAIKADPRSVPQDVSRAAAILKDLLEGAVEGNPGVDLVGNANMPKDELHVTISTKY